MRSTLQGYARVSMTEDGVVEISCSGVVVEEGEERDVFVWRGKVEGYTWEEAAGEVDLRGVLKLESGFVMDEALRVRWRRNMDEPGFEISADDGVEGHLLEQKPGVYHICIKRNLPLSYRKVFGNKRPREEPAVCCVEEDDNGTRRMAQKWRRTENSRMTALYSGASTRERQRRSMLPKPENVRLATSNLNGEEPEVIVTWDIKWNEQLPNAPSAEIVLTVIEIAKYFDLTAIDLSDLILTSKRKRLEKTFIVFPSKASQQMKMKFTRTELGSGHFVVIVWTRARFAKLENLTKRVIQVAPYLPENSTRLFIRPKPVAPKMLSVLKMASGNGGDIGVLRWLFTMVYPGVTFEVKMEVFDEAVKEWKLAEPQSIMENGKGLAFPLLHVKTNMTGTRRIAIPGIPSNSRVRFSVSSIDLPASTTASSALYSTPSTIVETEIVIPGGRSEPAFSNECSEETDDANNGTLCTICFESVSFDELATKPFVPVDTNETYLKDEPNRDPLCPSGPETCCHVFHAKCLHEWTTRHKKSTCPNCCRHFTQEVLFKRFDYIVCVPTRTPK